VKDFEKAAGAAANQKKLAQGGQHKKQGCDSHIA
jgi:hypothetical protein